LALFSSVYMFDVLTHPVGGKVLLGLATFLLLAAGVLAWRGFTVPVLLALLGLGFCLRLHTLCADPYLQPWDERYHALVARNMMAQPLVPQLYADPALDYDYRDWTFNRYWLHKPPLALWTIAGSMQLFGVNLLALRLPSLLFSTALIAIMFGMGRWLFSARVGLLAAFFVAISGVMVELPSGRIATDHVDMAFLFFTAMAGWTGLAFARQPSWIRAGLFAGALVLAVYTKWFTALFLLPVVAVAVFFRQAKGLHQEGSHRAKGFLRPALQLGVSGAAVLAVAWIWQRYTQHRFPLEAAWESAYNLQHLVEPLEGNQHEWYYHISRLGQMFGWWCFPALVWLWLRPGAAQAGEPADPAPPLRLTNSAGHREAVSFAHWPRASLSAWWLLPLLVFTVAATKMRLYVLPVAPVCWLATALLLDDLWQGMGLLGRIRLVWVRRMLVVMVFVWALIDLQGEVNLFKKSYGVAPDWMAEIDVVSEHLSHSPGVRPVVFNAHDPIAMMFHTGATAYSWVPWDSAWTALDTSRTRIILNHRGEGFHDLEQPGKVWVLDLP
jgi:4-amino-4-deoxy-L-arabinose transferase